MKKIINVVVVLLFVVLLFGCSENRPSDELIKKDIENSLMNYKSFLTIKDYEIEKSSINDNIYEASVNVNASSEYADFVLSVDLKYKLYDQGWLIEKSDWNEKSHEITNYPSEETLNGWIIDEKSRYLTINDNDWSISNIQKEEDSMIIQGILKEKVMKYIEASKNEEITFLYNVELDDWEISTVHSGLKSTVINKKLEGTYTNNQGFSIRISKVKDDHFMFSYNEYGEWEKEQIYKAYGSSQGLFRFRTADGNKEIGFTGEAKFGDVTYNDVCEIQTSLGGGVHVIEIK